MLRDIPFILKYEIELNINEVTSNQNISMHMFFPLKLLFSKKINPQGRLKIIITKLNWNFNVLQHELKITLFALNYRGSQNLF